MQSLSWGNSFHWPTESLQRSLQPFDQFLKNSTFQQKRGHHNLFQMARRVAMKCPKSEHRSVPRFPARVQNGGKGDVRLLQDGWVV